MMKPRSQVSIVMFVAFLNLELCGVCDAQNMIHRHGPDGIAFTPDDPLRAHMSIHRGTFFTTMNWAYEAPKLGRPDFPEDLYIHFLNLDDWETEDFVVFSQDPRYENRKDKWIDREGFDSGQPRPTSIDSSNYGNEMYVSGNGFAHDVSRRGRDNLVLTKENPAIAMEPAWLDNVPSLVKEARMEEFLVPVGTILGAYNLNDFDESLTSRLDLMVGLVHVFIEIKFLFISINKWLKVGSSVGGGGGGGDDITSAADLSSDQRSALEQFVSVYIDGGTVEGQSFQAHPADELEAELGIRSQLQTKMVEESVRAAAAEQTPSCVNIGIADSSSLACTQASSIFNEMSQPVKQLVNVSNNADDLGEHLANIQEKIDEKLQTTVSGDRKNTANRDPNWMKWRDPYDGDSGSNVNQQNLDRLVKSKLNDRLKEFERYAAPESATLDDDDPLVQSGGYLFNSLYLYGPQGRWLLDHNAADGNGDPAYGRTFGLIEDYVYARVNRLNPYHTYGVSGLPPGVPPGLGYAEWHRLDLIDPSDKHTGQTLVPWPPPPRMWGEGESFITGEEGATGRPDKNANPPVAPYKAAMALVSIVPTDVDEANQSGKLQLYAWYGFYTDPADSGDVLEIPWSPVVAASSDPDLSEDMDLPASYFDAGKRVRQFGVTVVNSLSPSPSYHFMWDLDHDRTIESTRGRSTRNIESLNYVDGRSRAACYVMDDDGRTGLALRNVVR